MKKAVSPIIATSILIALVITLAVIIWIFLSGFTKELTLKQGVPAESVCIEKVKISVDVIPGTSGIVREIVVSNDGEVPLAGFNLEFRARGRAQKKYFDCPLMPGQTSAETTSCRLSNFADEFDANLLRDYQKIKIVPNILGIGQQSSKKKLFECITSSEEFTKFE